jgi:hypothetical protein
MRRADMHARIASFPAGAVLLRMGASKPASGVRMNDPQLFQELGTLALEPMQPTDKKLIAAVFFVGLALLGALFFVQRWLPLAG